MQVDTRPGAHVHLKHSTTAACRSTMATDEEDERLVLGRQRRRSMRPMSKLSVPSLPLTGVPAGVNNAMRQHIAPSGKFLDNAKKRLAELQAKMASRHVSTAASSSASTRMDATRQALMSHATAVVPAIRSMRKRMRLIASGYMRITIASVAAGICRRFLQEVTTGKKIGASVDEVTNCMTASLHMAHHSDVKVAMSAVRRLAPELPKSLISSANAHFRLLLLTLDCILMYAIRRRQSTSEYPGAFVMLCFGNNIA